MGAQHSQPHFKSTQPEQCYELAQSQRRFDKKTNKTNSSASSHRKHPLSPQRIRNKAVQVAAPLSPKALFRKRQPACPPPSCPPPCKQDKASPELTTPIATAGVPSIVPVTPICDVPLEDQWLQSTPASSNGYKMSDFNISDKCLGSGAFAKVCLATHVPTGQRVAVKMIEKAQIPSEMQDYVTREPGVLAELSHKNIVKLLLTHEDSEFIYLFLQFVEGGDLHSRVEQDGAMSEAHARKLFLQLIDAVEYCHNRGICHRDLKLENALVSGQGSHAKLLLIDFGFAGRFDSAEHRFGDWPGSLCYCGPELLRGEQYVGTKADVYSLGVILFVLLHARYPHYSANKREFFQMITKMSPQFDDTITRDAKSLILWCMAKEPSLRPSIKEIRQHPFFQKESLTSPLRRSVSRMASPVKTGVTRVISETKKSSASPVVRRKLVF